MEFDVKRVYTPLNADELKVGSKCIFADTMATLRSLVKHDDGVYGVLSSVDDESFDYRFVSTRGTSFILAYLVEGPAPLVWTDLNVGDIIEKGGVQHMVISIDYKEGTASHINVAGEWLTDVELTYWTKVSYPKDNELLPILQANCKYKHAVMDNGVVTMCSDIYNCLNCNYKKQRGETAEEVIKASDAEE